MPFNGSGGFSPLAPPTFPAVDNTTILSDQLNLNLNDIFLGFGNCVTRDGQSPALANLPMGGFRHTGAGDAGAAGQYLVYGQAAAVLGNLAVTSATIPANGLYLPGANTVGLASNTTLRWSVNSTGNHIFAAPTAGDTVAITAKASDYGLSINTTGASWTGLRLLENSVAQWGLLTGNAGAGILTLINAAGTARLTATQAGNFTFAAPSSGNALGITSFNGGAGVYVSASYAAGIVYNLIENLSTAAGAGVAHIMKTGAGATGDVYHRLDGADGGFWSFGTDTSDSNAFVLSRSSTLGTSNGLKVTTGGLVKLGTGAAANTSTLMVNNANATATGVQFFQDSQESWIMGMDASSPILRWKASGSERMALTSNGLLTLSTNGIAELFRMTTSTARGSGNNYFSFYDPTGSKGYIGYGSGANDGFNIVNSMNASMTFYTNNTLRMTIAAGGKVNYAAGVYTDPSSVAFSATPTFDANVSNYFDFGTLTANVTSCTISNASAGQTITIRVKQDATGSRTFAAPSGAKITGSVTATASTASLLTLTYNGTDARWEGSWLGLPT